MGFHPQKAGSYTPKAATYGKTNDKVGCRLYNIGAIIGGVLGFVFNNFPTGIGVGSGVGAGLGSLIGWLIEKKKTTK